METGQNFTIYRGSSLTLRFTLTDDETGDPLNLTGSDISWQLLNERSSSTPEILYTVGDGVTVVDANSGIVSVTIASADSQTLGIKTYYHSLWVHTGSTCTAASEGTATVLSGGPRQCG